MFMWVHSANIGAWDDGNAKVGMVDVSMLLQVY